MLGTEYPIIQGAMRMITLGEMAAAVSRSGAFGVIGSSGLEGDRLRAEIRKARTLTDKPFGINIPVYRPNASEALEIAIEEGVKTVITSAGDPGKVIKRVKEAGVRMLQVVATVDMAKKAEAVGVDAVISLGFEGGGHVGRDEVATMVLVPQVVDAVKIPVIAAGGIGDGRGLVAAMALGAEGIQMGTRFLATKECPIEETYKQAILEAKDNGTIIAARKGYPLRVFKSNAAMTIRKMDESGVSLEEINAYVDKISRGSQDDRENRLMSAGQVSGMIKGIISVDELIRNMVAEAQTIAQSLGKTF